MQRCAKFCISLALCSPLRTAVVVRWLATRERRQSDRSIGMIYGVKIVIGSAFALRWFEHGGRWVVSNSPTVCEKHDGMRGRKEGMDRKWLFIVLYKLSETFVRM